MKRGQQQKCERNEELKLEKILEIYDLIIIGSVIISSKAELCTAWIFTGSQETAK